MISIKESRTIDASLDRVWRIVSDVDKDTDYWSGLSSIRNLRRDGQVVEREVVVGFMGRKGRQKITLHPKEEILLELTDGPLIGSRVIRLAQLRGGATRIDVSWEIEFSRIPVFAQAFVKSRLEESTKEALEKIAKTASSRLITC